MLISDPEEVRKVWAESAELVANYIVKLTLAEDLVESTKRAYYQAESALNVIKNSVESDGHMPKSRSEYDIEEAIAERMSKSPSNMHHVMDRIAEGVIYGRPAENFSRVKADMSETMNEEFASRYDEAFNPVQLIINVTKEWQWGIRVEDGKLSFLRKPINGQWEKMRNIPAPLLLYADAFMTQFFHLLDNKTGIAQPKASSETKPESCANITKNGDTTVVTPHF